MRLAPRRLDGGEYRRVQVVGLPASVVDEGVEIYVASCLAEATKAADPSSRLNVIVDDFLAGDFLAARTQLESTTVALEIAQAMLTRRS